MAKSEYINGIDKDKAAQLCAEYEAAHGRYPNLSVDENGRIEMYGGNAAERRNCRNFIARGANNLTPEVGADEAVTARQVGYIESLIDADPSAAMALNITAEKAKSLTKREANAVINNLKSF